MISNRVDLSLLVAAGCALGALACSSSSKGNAPSDAGSERSVADAGDEAEAAAGGVGVVSITDVVDGGGTLYAAFSESTPRLPDGCSIADAGACSVETCIRPDAGAPADAGAPDTGSAEAAAGDASFQPAPNPGTLTVSGGLFGTGTGVGPDAFGTYVYEPPAPIFAPGDKLGVSASGAQIPGFPVHTVVAPNTIDLTAPPQSGGRITVATTQPLTVSWTGGEPGNHVVVTATALFTSGNVTTTTCVWDASTGTATVPSQALKPLAVANALSSSILWYQVAQSKFSAGTVAVTLSAFVPQASLATFQ